MGRLLTIASAFAVVVGALMFTAIDAEAVSFVEPHASALAALPPQGPSTPDA